MVGRLRDNFIQGNKQVGGNITELSTGTQGEQFYGVEEVFEPRNSPGSGSRRAKRKLLTGN